MNIITYLTTTTSEGSNWIFLRFPNLTTKIQGLVALCLRMKLNNNTVGEMTSILRFSDVRFNVETACYKKHCDVQLGIAF